MTRLTGQQDAEVGALVPFYVDLKGPRLPIGYLRPAVVDALRKDNAKMAAMRMDQCFTIGATAVAFSDFVNEGGAELRSEHMDRLVRGWRHSGLFEDPLKGALELWRTYVTGPRAEECICLRLA